MNNNQELGRNELKKRIEFHIKENANITKEELYELYPNNQKNIISRHYNKITGITSKWKERDMIEKSLYKKSGKLRGITSKIVEIVLRDKEASLSELQIYFKMEGTALTDGEMDQIHSFLESNEQIEVDGDHLRITKRKNTKVSFALNGELKEILRKTDLLTTRIKDQNTSIISFKTSILDIIGELRRMIEVMGVKMVDDQKDVMDKVMANYNSFTDIKNLIIENRNEIKYNQERINELITVVYQSMNPNIKFKNKRKN